MLGEIKRSILNASKSPPHPRKIKHPVIDLKMELLVKNVNDFKL